MMAVYCQELNTRVLLGAEAMLGIERDDGGVSLFYRCLCGRRGRLASGRARRSNQSSGHIEL